MSLNKTLQRQKNLKEQILIKTQGVDEPSLAFRWSKEFCKTFIQNVSADLSETMSTKIIKIIDSQMVDHWENLTSSRIAKEPSQNLQMNRFKGLNEVI